MEKGGRLPGEGFWGLQNEGIELKPLIILGISQLIKLAAWFIRRVIWKERKDENTGRRNRESDGDGV